MNNSLSTENARLQALASYTILDTLPEEEYDAITRIAAQICQTPVSLITLLDDHRQWFKSAHGLTIQQTSRQYAFCDHAIRTPNQLMEVTDARTDGRFMDNPLTTGEPHVIFYAGVPLVDTDGQALGTLCVIDHKPNKLSDEQAVALKALAGQVVMQLQLRRSQALLKQANRQLQDSNQVLQAVVDNCPAGLVLWEALRNQGNIVDFRYVLTNPVNATLTGRPTDQLVGKSLKQLFPDVIDNGLFDRLATVVETGQRQQYQQLDKFDQISVWGDFSIVPVDADRVLFTIQDITKLKATEEQLRAQTEHLDNLVRERTARIGQLSALQNAILENTDLAIISSDSNGTIQTVNPGAQQLLQYHADELIGQTNPAFLFDLRELSKQAQMLSNQLNRPVKPDFDLFKAMLARQRYECTVIRKDGRPVPILMITSALRDNMGTPTGYVAMGTDISNLKLAKAELKRKNKELNTFFEVALDLHCIANTDGTILKANQAWQTVLGYTAAELQTINHFDLVHPEDRAATRAAIDQIVHQQEYQKNINRFRQKDGHYRLIEWNVVSADGLLYASARDITERKRAERALRQSEERYRSLVDTLREVVFEADLDGNWLFLNPFWTSITGYTIAESLGQSFLSYTPFEDWTENVRLLTELIACQKPLSRHVVRYQHKNGNLCWAEISAQLVVDNSGHTTRITGTITDITDRKQVLDALQQSEQRFREITEMVDELFWIRSVDDGRFLYMSPAYERVTGLRVESLYETATSFLAIIAHEDREWLAQEFAKNDIDNQIINFRVYDKDGVTRWFSVRSFVVRNEVGLPLRIISTAIDITSQKEKELVLQQSLEREQELNRLKSQFVATASHEFRTPLATIQSSVDLVKLHLTRDLPTSSASIDRHLGIIEQEVAAFSELLTDLLTVGRIEAGKVPFDPKPIDLPALINDLLSTHFGHRRDGHQVRVSVAGEPRPVRVDARLIDHALANLLSNAFKFSNRPPELRLTFASHQLVVSVIDYGIGIPTDDLPHLFDMFFRARNAVAIQGSGLGLAITRQFVELHGGTIAVCSEENKGTTFTVTLPG